VLSFVQGDQKVSVQLTIVLQSSGAQRLFDHPVYQVNFFKENIYCEEICTVCSKKVTELFS
jgi:hypothetical protein